MIFINSFLSYLMLAFVFVAAGGLAVFLGIRLRKKTDEKKAAQAGAESAE